MRVLTPVLVFLAGMLPVAARDSGAPVMIGKGESLDGTMTVYRFRASDTIVPWGAEMTPVFINYVARHGARYLSSSKKIDDVRGKLLKAREDGELSAKGLDFLRLIGRIDSVTAGRWGALSEVGINEERRLGRQMAVIAPRLLADGRVEAISTYVPRVVMSMYEFCHELAVASSNLEISTSEGKQYNGLLRFFDTDSAYVSYLERQPWKREYDSYAAATLPAAPAASLFTVEKSPEKMRKLSLKMYEVIQSLPAAGMPGGNGEWFTEEEYARCSRIDNLKHYYERTDNSYSTVAASAAIPLLRSIISTTDSVLSGKTHNLRASLHFGHAETVMPLFTLMDLPGCVAPEETAGSVAGVWNDSAISPLGANLMMVFLRDGSGKIWTALRLNGSWLKIGGSNLIPWPSLKASWLSRCTKYNGSTVLPITK